jgi:hypothetical protein
MAGPWGCAGPGRAAQDKVGTLDGGPRSPSWQSPRVCRATFRNRLIWQRQKQWAMKIPTVVSIPQWGVLRFNGRGPAILFGQRICHHG